MNEGHEKSETQKDESTYLGGFSGKTAHVDIPALNELFGGSTVPVEALNLVFDAPDKMTFGEVRALVAAMALAWDPARVHLVRLERFADSFSKVVAVAGARLEAAEGDKRLYLETEFRDAADTLDMIEHDLRFGPDDGFGLDGGEE